MKYVRVNNIFKNFNFNLIILLERSFVLKKHNQTTYQKYKVSMITF